MKFPDNFLWGAASAAYQVEGAADCGGKGPGIWDALCDGHVRHRESGKEACDHYHRYREDVALMKQMGLKAYRFSISWPRVLPREHQVNQEGLWFYRNLVEELRASGIRPVCTLYHWNLPMWAHEKGGWLWEGISDSFAEYVEVVAKALGDAVEDWITFNEAATFTGAGYLEGIHAPFLTPPKGREAEWACSLTKNVLLAHGKAVQILRKFTHGNVGIAMDGLLYLPKGEGQEEIEQAENRTFSDEINVHRLNWWLDPILLGRAHPQLERLLAKEEREMICRPLDFIGYNCYKANNLDDTYAPNPEVYPGLARTAMDWPITPDALYWAVRFLFERYHLPVVISENGMANIDLVFDDGAVHDPQRIQYLKWYLRGLKRAVGEGYPVPGYFYWSVLDNFEWAEGYDRRFGLIYVDYRTQRRILKDSALWYAKVIQEKGEEI